jgi:hypothetical protein
MELFLPVSFSPTHTPFYLLTHSRERVTFFFLRVGSEKRIYLVFPPMILSIYPSLRH